MKKAVRFTAALLIISLLTGSLFSSGAATFDTLDANTAVAGASALLSAYLEANGSGTETLAKVLNPTVNDNDTKVVTGESIEAPQDIIYENPSVGIVCAATYLKIRKGPSTETDVVGSAMNGAEITAVGEVTVDDVLWFKVTTADSEGYASGLFILFGKDAEEYKKSMQPEETDPVTGLRKMPSTFELKNSLAGLPAQQAEALTYYASEVRYCLETAYPEYFASGSYANTYSVIVYILEMLQNVVDISGEYGLVETMNQAITDAAIVEEHRANLSNVLDPNAEPVPPTEAPTEVPTEAPTEAPTAAPSEGPEETEPSTAAPTQPTTSEPREESVSAEGQAIVDYALQFVGWLPYVWGGASLTTGADCSGFCAQVYAHFGYLDQAAADVHAYDSYGLRSVGYEVSLDNISPGDMVCYQGHVAIYIGNGQIVHEPAEGRMCEIGSINVLSIIGVRRLY